MQRKTMRLGRPRKTVPSVLQQPGASEYVLPVLTWLSLVRLRTRRAQLRFARQVRVYQDRMTVEEMPRVCDPVMGAV